ncbi:hypothetical protein DM860_014565 [Cuscuta australis]|uniref:Uncharacterized protein n=1 Tax=Cuscuta australis TaxID=267555 RepID=A0A328DH35_9ASTE|nr:hypothetical protein DM860_014565 [Cuscuta australis]
MYMTNQNAQGDPISKKATWMNHGWDSAGKKAYMQRRMPPAVTKMQNKNEMSGTRMSPCRSSIVTLPPGSSSSSSSSLSRAINGTGFERRWLSAQITPTRMQAIFVDLGSIV